MRNAKFGIMAEILRQPIQIAKTVQDASKTRCCEYPDQATKQSKIQARQGARGFPAESLLIVNEQGKT